MFHDYSEDRSKFVIISVENHRGVIITKSVNGWGELREDWDMQLQTHRVIGEMYPVYSTGPERYRYHELESCHAYHQLFTRCMTIIPEMDWNENGSTTICGHSHREHFGICKHIDWDDYGRIDCECQGYTKPAPLMVIA